MTLLEAVRTFFLSKREPAHVQDLYAHLPDELPHSLRARIYENLGRHFRRVGRGLYVAVEGEAACVVVEGDAWKELRKIPSDSVDALVTDPPYAWLDHFVQKGSTRRRFKWAFERRDVDLELGRELYRVLREGAHAFLFVPALTGTTIGPFNNLVELLKKCGFVFNKYWIWDKGVNGMGYSGRARHEGIAFFSKGQKRQARDRRIPDVLSVPAVPPARRRHPTEKPQGLVERLIRFSTERGELVLDCFAGSLGVGRAALALGRDSIMIEKDGPLLAAAL